MDAFLKCLHRGERLEGIPEENHRGMTALVHGHGLQGAERHILLDGSGGETLLEHHQLVADLAKTNEKIAVSGCGVDQIAKLLRRSAHGVEPFRRGERQQCGSVVFANKFKPVAHLNEFSG